MNDPKKWWMDNIRSTTDDDLTDLVESFDAHGWNQEFPALADENGIILVGHRRMRAAETLGIQPVIRTLTFGTGDEADAERIRLAIVSNIGAKPLTAKDRQRIAQHLYSTRDWSQERIAQALDVSQRTISEDLRNLEVTSKLKGQPKTARNPRGAGRPKGKPRTTTAGVSKTTTAIREKIRPMVEAGDPINVDEVTRVTGHSRIVTEAAIAAERGRMEGLTEAENLGPVDVSTLGKTAKERFEALERRLEARIRADYERDVRAEVKRQLDNREEDDRIAIAQANEVLSARHRRSYQPFTAQEYYNLLWSLHPDNNDEAKRTAAFILVRQKKHILCADGPIKRKSDSARPLPTLEEMLAMRAARKRR